MSYIRPSGTAREQAIGGAMGSLGGDITANYVNPAGLGFYKTGEVVLSPGWSFGSTKTGYLSNNVKSPSYNNFIIGTSGVVFGWANEPDKSSAFSLAVNRSADFNGHISYQGKNNYSSASEAYVEEFNGSGLSVDDAISRPGISYGTRMALYTYLVDTSQGGFGPTIVQPEKYWQQVVNSVRIQISKPPEVLQKLHWDLQVIPMRNGITAFRSEFRL